MLSACSGNSPSPQDDENPGVTAPEGNDSVSASDVTPIPSGDSSPNSAEQSDPSIPAPDINLITPSNWLSCTEANGVEGVFYNGLRWQFTTDRYTNIAGQYPDSDCKGEPYNIAITKGDFRIIGYRSSFHGFSVHVAELVRTEINNGFVTTFIDRPPAYRDIHVGASEELFLAFSDHFEPDLDKTGGVMLALPYYPER